MANVSLVGLLEEYYGEILTVGREHAFYCFTREKAEEIFYKYRSIVLNQEFANSETTLSRNSPLLEKNIAGYTAYAVGGYHELHGREKIAFRTVQEIEDDIPAQRPDENIIDYVSRVDWPLLPPASVENEVRRQRIGHLKSLLLRVPSVTIPDQVWLLSNERLLDYGPYSSRPLELQERWVHLIDFLAAIRPLIDQGAVRIVSARRISYTAQFTDPSWSPDPDLLNALDRQYYHTNSSIFVNNENIVKYINLLPVYNCSAFYEHEDQIVVHQAATQERVARLNRAAGTTYKPIPVIHSRQVMKAADKLTISDLAEARLNERKLRDWFQCYSDALDADNEAQFNHHLRDGFDRVTNLSHSIVDRFASTCKLQLGAAIGADILISIALSQIGIDSVIGSLIGHTSNAAVHPLIKELFSDAPENDLKERAKRALRGQFAAFQIDS